MVSNGLNNPRWLTSLVPVIASHHVCSRPIINLKPLAFLAEPDICFVQKKRGTSRIVHNIPAALPEDDALTSNLSKDMGEHTINFNLEDNIHKYSNEYLISKQYTDTIPVSNVSPGSSPLNLNDKTHRHSQYQTLHLNHSGPLHFHRISHKQVHNHDLLSNPSPLTPEKRKYTLPKPPPHYLAPTITITDVDAHLRPSTPEPISTTDLWHTLKVFLEDPHWRAHSEYRERNNPFPFLDLNEGWNRARCDAWMWHQEHASFRDDGSLSITEEMTVRQSFAKFSLWAQREAMEFDEEYLLRNDGWAKVFDMVFKGERLGMCWARIPGSWGSPKPGLLTCCRGVNLVEEVDEWVYSIRLLVREWRKRNEGWGKIQKARKNTKRKWKYQRLMWRDDGDKERLKRSWGGWMEPEKIGNEGVEPRMIKMKFRSGEPMKVMNEKQRARRREQERKAGRWLDGTARQDRMWAEFHWVLNYDSLWDIHNIVWPRV